MGISELKFKIFFWGGLCPLNPHQGSALDPLGGLQCPPDPQLGWTRLQHVIKAFGL